MILRHELAENYLRRGWQVIPISHGEKAPRIPNWQKLRLTLEDLPKCFNNGQNVGVLLGEASGGLTDVDLDCVEALQVADCFLPPTQAVFGRPSKPKSHRLYRCGDSKTTRFEYEGVIAEVRSTGAQTVFPPSTHPSGEEVKWYVEGEPATVDFQTLRRCVAKLSACVLLSRHYPPRGSRQFAAMALAGWLLRNGWSEEETEEFLHALCGLAGDEESRQRLTQIRNTLAKVENGLPATGLPTLREYYPEEVLQKVGEWLELKAEKSQGSQLLVLEKFYPRPFTEKLIHRFHFWWPGGKEPLFWYDPKEGVWRDDGEALIAHELRTAVEELPDVQKRRYVIDEIVADVKGICWKGAPLPEPPTHLIPLKNGVFNIENGELREYRPEDFFTAKLPWGYNLKAKSKLIVPLMESFLPPEETVTLYELLAYSLFRDYPYQKLFLLYGRGSNGKSLFARILEALLGQENIANVGLRELQHDRFAASRLFGKLVNLCGELEYEDIERTGILKQLCGGDTLEADRKFREAVRFRNHAKLVFLTNEVPRSADTTEAFYRRLFLIEFPKQFQEEPQLEIQVATAGAEEYEALLFKVLETLKELRRRGFVFTRHRSLEETRETYLKLSSPLLTFVQECCEVTYRGEDYIFKYELKERFGLWLQEKGRTAYSDSRMKKELQALGVDEGRKGKENYWAWVGIKWKENGGVLPNLPNLPRSCNRFKAGENRFKNLGSFGSSGSTTEGEEEVTAPPAEQTQTLQVGQTIEIGNRKMEVAEVDLSNEVLILNCDGKRYGLFTDGRTFWGTPWVIPPG